MKGVIFSIEEFAVHDGPGLRVNVFMKGCPLRCKWCHNPEGWNPNPQIVKNPNGCLDCGKCSNLCPSPAHCILCKTCVFNCPRDLIRISGEEWEAKDLARRILKQEHIMEKSGGGVTVSGGEPLCQADFVIELLSLMPSLHKIIETCGFGDTSKFNELLRCVDSVYYDIKVVSRDKHIRYTGQPNDIILKNLEILKKSGVEFTIRIPFIRGVNDDAENLLATARLLIGAQGLKRVELLPYNELAGAKYALVGLQYGEIFAKPDGEVVRRAKNIFSSYGIDIDIR